MATMTAHLEPDLGTTPPFPVANEVAQYLPQFIRDRLTGCALCMGRMQTPAAPVNRWNGTHDTREADLVYARG